MSNYEYIDRVIIAAEHKIEGQKTVDVELVKTLIDALKSLNNMKAIEQIDNHQEVQGFLNYD